MKLPFFINLIQIFFLTITNFYLIILIFLLRIVGLYLKLYDFFFILRKKPASIGTALWYTIIHPVCFGSFYLSFTFSLFLTICFTMCLVNVHRFFLCVPEWEEIFICLLSRGPSSVRIDMQATRLCCSRTAMKGPGCDA